MIEYVDINFRASGKTSRLINWLKEDTENRLLIVHSYAFAKNLSRKYDLPPKSVMSADEFLGGRSRGLRKSEIRIDEIEMLLARIDPHITGFSGTRKDGDLNWRNK